MSVYTEISTWMNSSSEDTSLDSSDTELDIPNSLKSESQDTQDDSDFSEFGSIIINEPVDLEYTGMLLKPHFDFLDKLTDEEKVFIYDYSSEKGYHSRLNEILRDDTLLQGYMKEMYDTMIRLFNNGPDLLFPLTLYRGSDKFMNSDFVLEYFYSTSYSINQALKFTEKNNYLYVITCPPGNYTILPIEKLSDSPDELEVILPPKGKFIIQKIVSKAESNYNIDTIYITYIPENTIIIDTTKSIIADTTFWKKLATYFF
jgi:hypothetical protein